MGSQPQPLAAPEAKFPLTNHRSTPSRHSPHHLSPLPLPPPAGVWAGRGWLRAGGKRPLRSRAGTTSSLHLLLLLRSSLAVTFTGLFIIGRVPGAEPGSAEEQVVSPPRHLALGLVWDVDLLSNRLQSTVGASRAWVSKVRSLQVMGGRGQPLRAPEPHPRCWGPEV